MHLLDPETGTVGASYQPKPTLKLDSLRQQPDENAPKPKQAHRSKHPVTILRSTVLHSSQNMRHPKKNGLNQLVVVWRLVLVRWLQVCSNPLLKSESHRGNQL